MKTIYCAVTGKKCDGLCREHHLTHDRYDWDAAMKRTVPVLPGCIAAVDNLKKGKPK